MVVERIAHDPAKTVTLLEAEDFVVHRQDDGGYRVAGTIGDEDNASVPTACLTTTHCTPGGSVATMSAIAPVIEAISSLPRVLPAPAAAAAQGTTIPRSFRYSSEAAVAGRPPGTAQPASEESNDHGGQRRMAPAPGRDRTDPRHYIYI